MEKKMNNIGIIELNNALKKISNLNQNYDLLLSKNNSPTKGELKEIEKSTSIDLKDVEQKFLNHPHYINKLLSSNVTIKNFQLIPDELLHISENILACLKTNRLEFLKRLKDEYKNQELLYLLSQKSLDYPVIQIFEKSSYLKSLFENHEQNDKEIKYFLKQNPKNILSISPNIISDNFLHQYLIDFFKQRECQTAYLYSLRDANFWLDSKNTAQTQLLFQSLNFSAFSNKIDFNNLDPNNEKHNMLSLGMSIYSPTLTAKYFNHFGATMSNVGMYVSLEGQVNNKINYAQFTEFFSELSNDNPKHPFLMQYYDLELSKVLSLTEKDIDGNSNYTFANFRGKFQNGISQIDKFLTENNQKKHKFYSLDTANFLQLALFFINPHKFSDKEKTNHFRNLDKCIGLCSSEKAALIHIFEYQGDGKRTSGGYPFLLTPYLSEKWGVDIKDLRKLTSDDFYNMWTSLSLAKDMYNDLEKDGNLKTKSSMKPIRKF